MGTSRLYLPKFPGPLDQYKKAVQLKSLLQGQQLNQQNIQGNQLQLQQAEQQQQAQERVEQIIAKHNGDLRSALPEIKRVSPRNGRELQTWLTNWDRQNTQKKLQVLNLNIRKTQRKAQLASGVRDQSSYEAAVNRGLQEQLYDEPTAQRMLSIPYDPKNVDAIRRQALTSQQWFSLEQNRLQSERQQQQDALNAPEKVYDFLAQTLGTVRSQQEWTVKRNFVQARLKKMGVSEDYLGLIPEQYSPQAAQQMKQLGITPGKERADRRTATEIQIELYQKDPELYEQIFDRVGIRNERQMRLKIIEAAMRLSESVSGQVDEKVFAKKLAELSSLVGVSLENKGQAGRTATGAGQERFGINPETGERVVLKGGKWVPVPK